MPIGSFSAKRLDDLLTSLTTSDTAGVDQLRDVSAYARATLLEVEDPGRKVVAWVLMKQIEALCDRYEADPMTADASAAAVDALRTTVSKALRALTRASVAPEDAVQLAFELLELGQRAGQHM